MRGTHAFTRAAHIHVYVYIFFKIRLNKYTDGIIWSKESDICANCVELTHKWIVSLGEPHVDKLCWKNSQTRPNPAAGAICPKIHRWHCDSTSRVGGRLRPRAAFGAADSHCRHHCCVCRKVDETKKTDNDSSIPLRHNVQSLGGWKTAARHRIWSSQFSPPTPLLSLCKVGGQEKRAKKRGLKRDVSPFWSDSHRLYDCCLCRYIDLWEKWKKETRVS